MSERAAFHRKIAYGVAIFVLVFPLVWLSTPATNTSDGGRLAQLRKEHGLGQANLGEVDPASETMRFLTLGMRGVAVTLLWKKANEYKMKEDWTSLTATLEQLAKLQPNFINVWKYQAWNLTYNVSVEFDDYHDRYYYVIRGINYLKDGLRYNVDNPILLSDLGWFHAHKIGRADEHAQFRRLFKADDDYHLSEFPPGDERRDNWLVSKSWYQKAVDAVDIKGKSMGTKSPRDFYSNPPKSQINYAEAIEEEGDFTRAGGAWITGGNEWTEYGQREIKHTFGDKLRLGNGPELQEKLARQRAELDALGPTVRNELVDEKRKSLNGRQLKLLDTPREEVTPDQAEQWYALTTKTTVTDRDVAERIARDRPELAKQVEQLAHQMEDTDRVLHYTQSYKEIVNFDYWQLRCDFEQTKNALDARMLMFRAREAARGAEVQTAEQLYRQGFAKWRLVIDEFPALLEDETVFGDEVLEYTEQFRDVLDQTTGESIDESFPLWDALERFDVEGKFAEELAKHRARQSTDNADAPTGEEVER